MYNMYTIYVYPNISGPLSQNFGVLPANPSTQRFCLCRVNMAGRQGMFSICKNGIMNLRQNKLTLPSVFCWMDHGCCYVGHLRSMWPRSDKFGSSYLLQKGKANKHPHWNQTPKIAKVAAMTPTCVTAPATKIRMHPEDVAACPGVAACPNNWTVEYAWIEYIDVLNCKQIVGDESCNSLSQSAADNPHKHILCHVIHSSDSFRHKSFWCWKMLKVPATADRCCTWVCLCLFSFQLLMSSAFPPSPLGDDIYRNCFATTFKRLVEWGRPTTILEVSLVVSHGQSKWHGVSQCYWKTYDTAIDRKMIKQTNDSNGLPQNMIAHLGNQTI